jgi:hypothetical protein
MANELGTREPVKALISFSSDRKWGFIMPVHPTATKGVKITYQRKEAHINFWGAFQEFSRTVEKGFREYYQLEITDEPITIHGMKGYALFFSLEEYEKEPISERDETAESATTRVKVSGKSAKSGPTAKAGAESNTSGPESAATETTPATAPEPSGAPEAEEDNFALALQELNEMLDNREATIEELKARLKGYEEKFGQL